jgi:nucleoside-diphosphate-sugar epimerase
LIHVRDMARAIEWAITREADIGGAFLSVNTGSNRWNYQISELATGVKNVIGDLKIDVNKNAEPDRRSYRVDFGLFERLAPGYTPQVSLKDAVSDLHNGLLEIGFSDSRFRSSHLIRLNMLRDHLAHGRLNKRLKWV